jgi:hypothetical protein
MRAQTRTVALMSDRDEDDDQAPDLVTMKFPGRDKPADRGPMIGPIEKGIPLPVQGGRRTNPITVALLETQPGDSIFFRGLERSKASGYAAAAREKMGEHVRFATRAIGDGTRVWRVS